jgi:uncharacterized lipoprotein YmbA
MKNAITLALLLLTACASPQKEADTEANPAADSIMTADPANNTIITNDDDVPDTTAMRSPDNKANKFISVAK